MSDLDGPEPSRGGGRATPLWVGAVVLAAAATAILVLSDDARLLKLGLIAALWAALISAFAVAKLRGQAVDGEERAAELQRTYQRELEREVAARREFEAEAEADARRRAAEDSAHEIQALRAELNGLRRTLEGVVGGDVLFERVALRAESTRVRSMAEQDGSTSSAARLHPAAEQGWGKPTGQDGGVQGVPPPVEQARANPPASNPVASFPAAPNAAAPGPVASYPASPRGAGAFPAAASNPRASPPPTAGNGPTGPDDVTGQAADDQVSEQRTEMFPRVSGQQLAVEDPQASPDGPVESGTPWTSVSRTSTDSTRPPEHSQSDAAESGETGASPGQPAEQRSSQVEAGAHAEGTSVTELLAAYGDSTESQRRRRRRG